MKESKTSSQTGIWKRNKQYRRRENVSWIFSFTAASSLPMHHLTWICHALFGHVCQVGSALVMVVFVQRLTLTSRGGKKLKIEGRLETLDCISSCTNLTEEKNQWLLLLSRPSWLMSVRNMEIQSVIVYLDYPLWCKLSTIPFRLSHFPNAADLLNCNKSATPLMLPRLWSLNFLLFHCKWVSQEGQ